MTPLELIFVQWVGFVFSLINLKFFLKLFKLSFLDLTLFATNVSKERLTK